MGKTTEIKTTEINDLPDKGEKLPQKKKQGEE